MLTRMRCIMKCAVLSLLPALALLATTVTAHAEETPAAAAQPPGHGEASRIFQAQAHAGYLLADSQDNETYLQTYDPLKDSPVFGFDLLYLTPSFGAANIEADFLNSDSWNADLHYNRGANVAVEVSTQKTNELRPHRGVPPSTNAASGMTVPTGDLSPDADYSSQRQETFASLKLHAPGYPAHFRASGRLSTLQGNQELIYFGRTCTADTTGNNSSASGCHVDSRKRALDQETQEYVLGADSHFGPVDLAYSHTMLTFRDREPDPADYYGAFRGGLPAGIYTHNANPDLKSFADEIKLNTALTNRMVLALHYRRAEAENESVDITRGDQRAGANLSYTISSTLSLVARYEYAQEKTLHLSAAVEAERNKTNDLHKAFTSTSPSQSHIHAVRPQDKAQTGEIVLRFTPISPLTLNATVRRRSIEKEDVYLKVGDSYRQEAEKSDSTLASFGGSYRVAPSLKLEADLGQEWTSVPAYASDLTSLLRYSAGATWIPGPIFTLQAIYHGYQGKNDDLEALEESYHKIATWRPGFERTTNGDALTVLAALIPARTLSFTAMYSLANDGIEQDMLFGSAVDPNPNAYIASDTQWVGKTQVWNLRGVWAATRRLSLTADGTIVEGSQSYDPVFALSSGLKELGAVKSSKYFASLKAEVRLTEHVGLNLTGFWIEFDDQQHNRFDGSVTGLLVAANMRW